MKTAAAILTAATLAGCAPTYYQAAPLSPVEQARLECRYDAQKATASIRSGIEAGWTQGTLTDQCMRAKGYTR